MGMFLEFHSIFFALLGVASTALSVYLGALIIRYVFKDVIDKYLNK